MIINMEREPEIIVITHLFSNDENNEPHVERVVNLDAGIGRAKVIIHEGLQIVADPYTFQFFPPESIALVEVKVVVPEGVEEKGTEKAN